MLWHTCLNTLNKAGQPYSCPGTQLAKKYASLFLKRGKRGSALVFCFGILQMISKKRVLFNRKFP